MICDFSTDYDEIKSTAIREAASEAGGYRVIAQSKRLTGNQDPWGPHYELANGYQVIETNADPVGQDDDGFEELVSLLEEAP